MSYVIRPVRSPRSRHTPLPGQAPCLRPATVQGSSHQSRTGAWRASAWTHALGWRRAPCRARVAEQPRGVPIAVLLKREPNTGVSVRAEERPATATTCFEELQQCDASLGTATLSRQNSRMACQNHFERVTTPAPFMGNFLATATLRIFKPSQAKLVHPTRSASCRLRCPRIRSIARTRYRPLPPRGLYRRARASCK